MILTKNKIIGITGGIASGKTSLSQILIKKGYPVIDADKISRSLLKIGLPSYREIVHEFGSQILNDDKTVNRRALSKLIFDKKTHRDKLEAILHPYIFRQIKILIREYSKKEKIIFVDIPLLYEKYDKLLEYNIYLNKIYLVYVDRDTQIKRLMNRDTISIEEAEKKIYSQIPI